MGSTLLQKRFVIPFFIAITLSLSHASEQILERKNLEPVGEIVFVAGKALARLVPEERYRPATPRQELVTGDIIKTLSGGRVSILFRDETQLKLAANTTLFIKEVTSPKEKPGALKILLRLETGEVWTRSKSIPDGLMIETPYATAAIRGTEWSLSVQEQESKVVVMEGSVELSNPLGSITVGKNELATVLGAGVPVKSILIRPRDRIQWTYYLAERRLLRFLKFREGGLSEAEILFNEGRLDESAKIFEKILSADPRNRSALRGLGLIELKRGNNEKAENILNRFLELHKDLLPLLGKAYLSILRNRTDEAAEILAEAKISFPRDPLPYIFSSYLRTFHGDFAGALTECDSGLSILPNNPALLSQKADIYFILDKPEEAKAAIETLLAHHPDSSEGYERLGMYHRVVTGDARKAKEAFERSIRLDRLNDEAIAKLADLLREQGYIAEAIRLTQEAISIAPWNAMHHYNYGRLLADINRIDEARMEFRKSLDLDTTFSRAYLGEGIVLLKEGKRDEALKELSKASLFEPNLSEIHNFLAIAYYQKHEVKAALDELKRAEECDPLDSTPHQLASAIYNDLYMPEKAIEEARKVLDLLPYKKASGEALLEGAQNGTMSVNRGLDFFDLPEWSLYYAQKALFIDPYRNTSHIAAAMAFNELGQVSSLQGFNEFASPFFSERLQGLALNVNSLNFSNRYSTLISKPGHYLTVGGTYARAEDHRASNATEADLTVSGDFGSQFPLTYFGFLSGGRDEGPYEHSDARGAQAELLLGYKPDYDHDIFLDLNYWKEKMEVTRAASIWYMWPGWSSDDNQEYKNDFYNIQLGYHKRFSPISHLIADLRYHRGDDEIDNPDFPIDSSGFGKYRVKIENSAFGVRHMFTLLEDHQASYGMDYNQVDSTHLQHWPYLLPAWDETDRSSFMQRSLTFHIYDRWVLQPKITLDAGLFLSYFSTDADFGWKGISAGIPSFSYRELYDREATHLNPRLGVAIDLGQRGTFRVAYQRRSTTGFLGELAPVGAAGLIPPTFDISFSNAEDVQGSVEYELTKKTFLKGLIGYESLHDLAAHSDAQLWYGRVAINQILGRYFSLSVRYHYNASKSLDGPDRKLPGIPRDSGDARLVFIHPSQISLSLRQSYMGERFADYTNRIKLKGFYLTDFSARKEFLKKRFLLAFAVGNLFNKRFETISHPYWWSDRPLPGRGRTFSLRGEFRY
jgi:tetratricopeptide (TPR) repeat protein